MSDTVAWKQLCDSLEATMDKHGPHTVLTAIAAILGEKADHIRSNWQDERMADRFERASESVLKVADLTR
jgi:hypothetical protein